MTIYNFTKLCDSPLYIQRDGSQKRESKTGKEGDSTRRRKGSRRKEGGWGTCAPFAHVPERHHQALWPKKQSFVLCAVPFCGASQGINKNVSRCWAARDCGRKIIDVGWCTHHPIFRLVTMEQSIKRAQFQCSIVKPQRRLNTENCPMFPVQLITLWWTLPIKFPKVNSF